MCDPCQNETSSEGQWSSGDEFDAIPVERWIAILADSIIHPHLRTTFLNLPADAVPAYRIMLQRAHQHVLCPDRQADSFISRVSAREDGEYWIGNWDDLPSSRLIWERREDELWIEDFLISL